MSNSHIGNKSQVQIAILENHIVELHQAAVLEERSRIMNELRLLVKEKTERGDHDTISIINWVIDRLNKEI
jgi:ferritin